MHVGVVRIASLVLCAAGDLVLVLVGLRAHEGVRVADEVHGLAPLQEIRAAPPDDNTHSAKKTSNNQDIICTPQTGAGLTSLDDCVLTGARHGVLPLGAVLPVHHCEVHRVPAEEHNRTSGGVGGAASHLHLAELKQDLQRPHRILRCDASTLVSGGRVQHGHCLQHVRLDRLVHGSDGAVQVVAVHSAEQNLQEPVASIYGDQCQERGVTSRCSVMSATV